MSEITLILFIATLFRTIFGFGEALVAVPLLALVIPIRVAVPVAVLASILIAAVAVVRDWKHIHFREAGWLIGSTLFGLPIGLLVLKTAPENAMKAALGFLILFFVGYSLFKPRTGLKNDRWAWAFGFVAGIAGGSYGMNGPPLAIYGKLRDWSPDRFRATLQGYFLPASILGLCGYGVSGLWTASVNSLFLSALPGIIAGIFIGRWMNRRIDARRFRFLLHGGLILVAVLLISGIA